LSPHAGEQRRVDPGGPRQPPIGQGPAEQGTLPERPLLGPWFRRQQIPLGLRLEYGDAIVDLGGSAVDALVPLLDGTRTIDELATALAPLPRQVVEDLVATLAAEGVVVAGPPTGDEEALREAALAGIAPSVAAKRLASARISLAGTGPLRDELARLLPGRVRCIRWDEPACAADLAVAAPAAEQLPELRAWNMRCLEAELPWLLVLPFNGRFAAVGPLFVPGETCCYACLARRRAAALPDPAEAFALELAPGRYPLGRSLAAALAGLACACATRWLARRDAALPGAFFALELQDGPALTRHRVLRVPRCEACSPASDGPPLLPWASEEHR
jgi:bacteriocin biosynthesis cyclodehydratase domain-containing protein